MAVLSLPYLASALLTGLVRAPRPGEPSLGKKVWPVFGPDSRSHKHKLGNFFPKGSNINRFNHLRE